MHRVFEQPQIRLKRRKSTSKSIVLGSLRIIRKHCKPILLPNHLHQSHRHVQYHSKCQFFEPICERSTRYVISTETGNRVAPYQCAVVILWTQGWNALKRSQWKVAPPIGSAAGLTSSS